MVYRRVVLKYTSATLLSTAGGCISWDYPRHRDLRFRSIELEEDTESDSFTVSVAPMTSFAGGSEEWEVFHDVQLIGYADSGEEVCREPIGNLIESKEYSTKTMTCSEFPHRIVFSATESPCDEDTTLEETTFTGMEDGRHVWRTDDRECSR